MGVDAGETDTCCSGSERPHKHLSSKLERKQEAAGVYGSSDPSPLMTLHINVVRG